MRISTRRVHHKNRAVSTLAMEKRDELAIGAPSGPAAVGSAVDPGYGAAARGHARDPISLSAARPENDRLAIRRPRRSLQGRSTVDERRRFTAGGWNRTQHEIAGSARGGGDVRQLATVWRPCRLAIVAAAVRHAQRVRAVGAGDKQIALRRAHPFFTVCDASAIRRDGGTPKI